MGQVPPRYSSHYQNIHLVSNPEQLQKDGGCVEGEERWIAGEERFPAAAAAKLAIDLAVSDETFTALWDIVTSFWRRNYEGIML